MSVQKLLPHGASLSADAQRGLREFVEVHNAIAWLEVLAVPQQFRGLSRRPTRAHLLQQINTFLSYARSGQCDTEPTFDGAPYDQREARALRLRAMLETWEPPDLPISVTLAAREALFAEGLLPPDGWDNLPAPDGPLDDYLSWPEESGA